MKERWLGGFITSSHKRTENDQTRRHTAGRKRGRRRRWHPVYTVVVLAFLCVAGISAVTQPPFDQSQTAYEKTDGYQISDDSDTASQSTCMADPDSIPDYSGQDYIVLNDGIPNFTSWDVENISGQTLSPLDSLGRCGVAYAKLDQSMAPTEERGSIGQIKPTGWVQNKYEGVVNSNPPYLYNRCHLIAYALTGENANELNLITGTRYMNVSIMLPWEEQVMKYLDASTNHVLYRVTPYFAGKELLARGVEMEAYSIEDNGEGICYHIFVYNVQPGVEIDYRTGDNWLAE